MVPTHQGELASAAAYHDLVLEIVRKLPDQVGFSRCCRGAGWRSATSAE